MVQNPQRYTRADSRGTVAAGNASTARIVSYLIYTKSSYVYTNWYTNTDKFKYGCYYIMEAAVIVSAVAVKSSLTIRVNRGSTRISCK